MYEAKYSRYITKNQCRFDEVEEITAECAALKKNTVYANKGCGVPLYYNNGVLYVDNSDAHYYIQGGTGSKKTRVQAMNLIRSILTAGENMIINDPKGELFRKTAGLAKLNGYRIRVLNFRNVNASSGYNPLSFACRLKKQGKTAEAGQAINDFAEAVMAPARTHTNDTYWADSAAFVINYAAHLLMESVPEEFCTLANMVPLTQEGNGDALKRLMDDMDEASPVAYAMHAVLDLRAEKTLSCIYSTLQVALKPFLQNAALLKLLSHNEISFDELILPKTVVYVIYPDEKDSLSFLVNLFFTQCYQYLIDVSSGQKDGRLKNRINFVLDEFSNLPSIPNFENRISEARGHNIRYYLFSQSYSQLKNKYHENADTVIANCDWIIFPSKEVDFLSQCSRLCGKRTDYNGVEHDLVSPCDMQHLKKTRENAEVLILKSGHFPFITALPDYAYLDVFASYPEADDTIIIKPHHVYFLAFEDWLNGIYSGKFRFPYPNKIRKSML